MTHDSFAARRAAWVGLLVLAAVLVPVRQPEAAGFAVLITPPRFELRAQPGEVLRQVLEITNAGDSPTRLGIQTAEWEFGDDGAVVFSSPLAEGSCRPWSALEARELELGPGGRRRYRFEVAVPRDAPDQECRFAILFEGDPEPVGGMALPVAGRLAIIVYVAVGDARAALEVLDHSVITVTDRALPALTVTNTGSAHTRLEGFVSGRDASGRELVFAPQGLPVLPGQTRTLALYPQGPEGEPPQEVSFPIRLSGRLEWSGRPLNLDELFAGE
jgi:fimbrial chaperone protein